METLYMGEEQIVVKIGEKEKTYPAGVSFLSIAQEYQDQYEDDIVLALYNNRLRELKKTVKKDGELSFLTTSDKTGKRAYRRSVTLLMQKAVYNLWGREHIGVYVRYAIGQGPKILREYRGSKERAGFLADMLDHLSGQGRTVETVMRTKEGEPFSVNEEETKYILYQAFPGAECDTKNRARSFDPLYSRKIFGPCSVSH